MSLAVAVELLSGRYVATAFNTRSQGEWPPHPARLFSAATAAWADADEPDPEERSVLQWLERQSPPVIACSHGDDVARRTVATHFVPINDVFATTRSTTATAYDKLVEAKRDVEVITDKANTQVRRRLQQAEAQVHRFSMKANQNVLKHAQGLLPDMRGRQPRTFPTITPADPRVTYIWPDAEPTPRQRSVIDGLLARVGRLGHSSSLVSCEVTEVRPPATLSPDPAGEFPIRVPAEGQLDLLDAEHAHHRGILPRVLASAMQAYTAVSAVPEPAVERTVFSSRWISFTLDELLPVSVRGSLPLARALRAALIEHAPEAPPFLLTGRDAGSGSPTRAPHAAVLALPFVGHNHADGLNRGMAIVLPREVDDHERRMLARSVQAWEKATDGVLLLAGRRVRLVRSAGVESLVTLRPWSWSREATEWATVTPIALDRFPGDPDAGDPPARRQATANAAATIARACVHIGLPEPVEVEPTRAGTLAGVPAARAFPPFRTPNGGPQRLLMHARLRFDEPVAGPVLLGAGRYVGQGLCWPLAPRGARA